MRIKQKYSYRQILWFLFSVLSLTLLTYFPVTGYHYNDFDTSIGFAPTDYNFNKLYIQLALFYIFWLFVYSILSYFFSRKSMIGFRETIFYSIGKLLLKSLNITNMIGLPFILWNHIYIVVNSPDLDHLMNYEVPYYFAFLFWGTIFLFVILVLIRIGKRLFRKNINDRDSRSVL